MSQRAKVRAALREMGRPSLLAADSPEVRWAMSRVRSFRDRGMTPSDQGVQVGLHRGALSVHLANPGRAMWRSTFDAIRRVRFEPSGNAPAAILGPQRRLQALRADGWAYYALAERMGHAKRSSPCLLRIIKGDRMGGEGPLKYVLADTARKIEEMYDEFAAVDPVARGVTANAKLRSVNHGRRNGYAPSSCWDSDTIDDPEALPEWTGMCGTLPGYRVHLREDIPVCPACRPFAGRAGRRARSETPSISAARILLLREKTGLSQSEFARVHGINVKTMYYWETGRAVPSWDKGLQPLLSALDATIDDICEDE